MNNRMKVGLRGAVAAVALATTLNGGLPAYAQPKTEAPMVCNPSVASQQLVARVRAGVLGNASEIRNTARADAGDNVKVVVKIDVDTQGKATVRSAEVVAGMERTDVKKVLGEDLLKSVALPGQPEACTATVSVVLPRD